MIDAHFPISEATERSKEKKRKKEKEKIRKERKRKREREKERKRKKEQTSSFRNSFELMFGKEDKRTPKVRLISRQVKEPKMNGRIKYFNFSFIAELDFKTFKLLDVVMR